MNNITISVVRPKSSILDKSLSKGKGEVSLSCFALLFSEIVQYCQNRVYTVPELQNKLSKIGQDVGLKLVDLYFVREKNCKREIKLLNMLLFIKTTLWKGLFGREADKLEHANDDERTYYLIENEALVNKFISKPKDKGSLNCAVFTAGIIEAVLNSCGFTATVTVHWHKGTTYLVQFDESVIARDKQMEER
uniref:Trafficking protein particle complex subunit 5 n=1 Tax=Clastoptera arizonana TaxID=38151 RepID=A0A1B6CK81_9HEMI